jgi:hypothetical protein
VSGEPEDMIKRLWLELRRRGVFHEDYEMPAGPPTRQNYSGTVGSKPLLTSKKHCLFLELYFTHWHLSILLVFRQLYFNRA